MRASASVLKVKPFIICKIKNSALQCNGMLEMETEALLLYYRVVFLMNTYKKIIIGKLRKRAPLPADISQ